MAMARGLWRLTWLEIKIFVREPMGVIGTVGIPVLLFVLISRMLGPRVGLASPGVPRFVSVDLPIFTSLMIAASAVQSLVGLRSWPRSAWPLDWQSTPPLARDHWQSRRPPACWRSASSSFGADRLTESGEDHCALRGLIKRSAAYQAARGQPPRTARQAPDNRAVLHAAFGGQLGDGGHW